MPIPSLALKTAALIALISVPLPASTQQLSTNQLSPSHATKNAATPVATAQTSSVATSIVLTISTPSTLSYGEDVGGYALVTSSDGTALSGTVSFYDGATNICTIPVTQTTSCPPNAGTGFAAGTHLLTAAYSGDATHQSSTSNGVPIMVVPDVTTLSVASSANPAGYGSSVTFTVTAQGDHAIPSGQIQFLDGASLIVTATLNPAGTASIAESTLKLGTHPITARYAATQNFGAAASAVLSQVIQTSTGIATSTMLASNLNPATAGQSVSFTADVVTAGQSLVPTGTVTFLDGSTVLGTSSLNSFGLATLSTSSLVRQPRYLRQLRGLCDNRCKFVHPTHRDRERFIVDQLRSVYGGHSRHAFRHHRTERKPAGHRSSAGWLAAAGTALLRGTANRICLHLCHSHASRQRWYHDPRDQHHGPA
jgi:hypothetical protein